MIWVFTFGYGQQHEGKYVVVHGEFLEARKKMIEKYGKEWAFQYSEGEWNEWERNRPWYIPAETLLDEF